MELRRSKHKATANSIIHVSDISHYIRIIIDIYSSASIKRDLWLTEREKQFYIATVIHYLMGYDNPISDESIQIYKKYFNYATNKAKISDYINRVREKEWLRYNKKKKVVEIPSIFHGIGEHKDVITFNMKFSYEHEQTDRSDTDGDTGQEYSLQNNTHSIV